jgi:hypothetical protein
MKLLMLRRPKAACSFSYVDYRSKTNAAILWEADHTKRKSHTRRYGQGKETKNLNVVDLLSVEELIKKS